MTGSLTVWIGLAGGAGAVVRFVADGVVRSRLGRAFPYGTLAINIGGSLLLGVFTGFVIYDNGPVLWTTVGGVGFCGGFTTFSTASFETVRLIQERRYRLAWGNGLITLALTISAAAAGLWLTRI